MPPAKKMKIRTIVTSAVASVAVVGAVLLPVMLRGNNKTEGEPTNTSALIELDDGTVENSAYSRISAYSAFSIFLFRREKSRTMRHFQKVRQQSPNRRREKKHLEPKRPRKLLRVHHPLRTVRQTLSLEQRRKNLLFRKFLFLG